MTAIDDLPEGLDKRVALTMHERGTELTPDQVHEISRGAISKVRDHMRGKGYDMPDSDCEMVEKIRDAQAYARSLVDDYPPEEIINVMEDEEIDIIMARFDAEVARLNVKNWYVVGPDNEIIQRYETEQAAKESCLERNRRAKAWKLTVRYAVMFMGFDPGS